MQPLPEVGPPITNIYQYVSTVYYIFTETYHVFCFHLFWISWFSEPTSKTSTKSSGNTVDTWERGNRSNISSIHGLVFWFSAKTSGKCRRIACFLKSGYLITPSFFQEKEFVLPKSRLHWRLKLDILEWHLPTIRQGTSSSLAKSGTPSAFSVQSSWAGCRFAFDSHMTKWTLASSKVFTPSAQNYQQKPCKHCYNRHRWTQTKLHLYNIYIYR